MRYKNNFKLLFILSFSLSINSCKKYLNAKSDQSLSTPGTLDDLQDILNSTGLNQATFLNNGGTDEYYLNYNDWLSRVELQNKGYVWDAQLDDGDDWTRQYQIVFYANTILYNLEKISSAGNQQNWNKIKGSAYFIRAHAFYQIAQLFAPQFDSATASADLGIPLRLNADFNQPSIRASVKDTYDQVIRDLKDALTLLPANLPVNKQYKAQATRTAAFALLARVYLQAGDYNSAKKNADSCLALYNNLLDFNSPEVDSSSASPIPPFNDEVIFYATSNSSVNSNAVAKIDSVLYNSFDDNDLRKSVFFMVNSDGTSHRYKGSYNGGSVNLFNGIATDEVYLIRSECNARQKNTADALQDLNTLLSKRWSSGAFTPYTTSSPDDALALILTERKKELIYRGTRWSDLKRLNKDPRFATILKRSLNGKIYSLTPNDLRYTLLIPRQVMNLTGIPQTPR